MISKKELDSLPHDYSILLNLKPSSEFSFYSIFDSIPNPSVLVSLGRPASSINHILKRNKTGSRHLHIIDAISHEIGAEKVDNATYLNSGKNLGELSMHIEKALLSSPGSRKTLVFDSIAKLSRSHDSATIVGFLKFLNTRLKDMNAQAVFLSEKRVDYINSQIMHLMDRAFNC